MHAWIWLVFCTCLLGCATMPPREVTTASAPGARKGQPATAAAATAPAQRAVVPEPPAHCAAFLERSGTGTPLCAERRAALGELALALASADANLRDGALRSLESCTGFPPGVVRALRAELAPVECGDALTEPLLAKAPSGLRADVRDVLAGLALAARAARLVRDPPRLARPHDKARVQDFVQGLLKDWIERQAVAVQELSVQGAALDGYGKGIVAVEAGLADMRFVEVARAAPVPDEIDKDAELREAYLTTLEQALDPRKTRGRDAALVGLKKLSEVGVIHAERVDRARELLSKAYAGRRIDALDALLLPPLPALRLETTEQKLAAKLPTFYVDVLLADADTTQPAVLRALLEHGLPRSTRSRLEAANQLVPESRLLFARALLALGQRYWRSGDAAAAATVAKSGAAPPASRAEAELVDALGAALAAGPKDAAEMMLKGPHLPRGAGDVAALDAFGLKKSELAGAARYDAALLLELARPAGADPSYWKDVATRYRSAAKLLTDAAQRARAEAGAKAADATAAALGVK